MRNRAGKIIVDLNKAKQPATASIDYPITPTVRQIIADEEFINENETTYALFPYELNDPPILTKSIYAASTPTSIHINAYKPQFAGKVLFHDDEGVVKVLAGTNIILRVEAVQPSTLNVENGIPTLIQKKDKLIYNWTFNGTTLLEEEGFFDIAQQFTDNPILVNNVEINQNELIIRNVTDELNGTYVCLVTNDIGEISSEAIELQVIHTNKLDNKYFRQNLIKNGFARDSTSEWTAIQGGIVVQPFALREAESELKKPNTPLRQHSVNEIYPHPITIGSNGIRNYDLSSLATENSFFFTRTPYAKYVDGGRPQSIVYQDIDVTEIQDLIAGRVYGCEGVRAYIGCVVGNSIEYRAMDVLLKANPNDPKYFYQGAPRLSFENTVLTGTPRFSGERAYVIIQEFEGNTQLSSRRYINESERARRVTNIVLTDPITTSRDSNGSFYMEKVRRPSYLDEFKYPWEGGSNNAPIHLVDHIHNPQNLPDGIDSNWLNETAYSFSPYTDDAQTTLHWKLQPVWWPQGSINETYRSETEWIGSDPTRILNTYSNLFYGHIQDPEYKKSAYYSYGQYAEYKDAVITALNPRTTKIRVTIVFDSWYDGNTEGDYPTLYGEYDRPQIKHGWGYGDPLFAYPQWTSPVGIGVFKSPKILWQSILDNRHIEKVRAIPITADAGYQYRLEERRKVVKSYVGAIKSIGDRTIFGVVLQGIMQEYLDLVDKLGASNYDSTTNEAQKKKDYAQLGRLTSTTRRRILQASARYSSVRVLRNHPIFTARFGLLMVLMQGLLRDLLKKSSELANYIKNWTPFDNTPAVTEKRNEAWSEMDRLKYERAGKKEPTSMVTALGLILEPITSGSGDISTFRSSIMRLPTKEQDLAQRPKPINTLQTESAKQFKIVALERL